MHEPADRRAAQRHRHRRIDRRLRHHRLAGEERAGVERQGRHHRFLLSRLHDAHGGDQSAPGAEGGGAAKPDGRRLDGRRLVPQRRIPHQRARLRRRPGHQQGARAAASSRSARATTTRATSKRARSADFAKMLGIEHYPGVRKFLENPAYTDFWSLQAVDKWLAAQPLTVPTHARGRASGTRKTATARPRSTARSSPRTRTTTWCRWLIGPWRHSGANHYGYDLGALTFTGDTAREWRVKYVKPFFDH